MKNFRIILASNSPRRKELLAGLDIPFEVKVIQGIDESYPESLPAYETALYIAVKKAEAYRPLLDSAINQQDSAINQQESAINQQESSDDIRNHELLILTADTVVIAPSSEEQNDQEGKGIILGKPKDAADAIRMLEMLSGKTHHVVTGVCITSQEKQRQFSVITEVTFKKLSKNEIDYYVEHYKPFDKAGAYGIQEWIGYIGCTSLKGSYFNVMGLPVQRIYEELKKF